MNELKPLTNGVEALSGFPVPRKKWEQHVERPVIKAVVKLTCPKCGGNHSAIRCERI
jgi:ribosomal protein L44E